LAFGVGDFGHDFKQYGAQHNKGIIRVISASLHRHVIGRRFYDVRSILYDLLPLPGFILRGANNRRTGK
jgi:hypothetical protein